MSPPPRATYRLQLRPGFGFDEAAAIAPYLARLGVSHVYTSPYLQSAPGSTHGYDVVDHSRVDDELGGAAAHERFVAALERHGLGQVVDVVPNHMAIGSAENAWWWDVLATGRASRFAGYFDVDWDPPESKLRDTVLVPILGDHYGRVLERGEIRLARDPVRGLVVRYAEHELPIAPSSLDDELRRAVDGGSAAEVEAELAAVNADLDRLHALLDRQHHRLAYWRVAGEDLDYRRFFDIASLAALRVEDGAVFADTHALILRWVADGEVEGLRIDHPDGLWDPAGYFELLRAAAPDAWIVVEKILEPGEALPVSWPVDGTTGYDFCHLVTRLFHDARGEGPIRAAHREHLGEEDGEAEELGEVIHRAKLAVLHGPLAADLARLTQTFAVVAESHRDWRDLTRRDLRDALAETAAAFEVYRTYVAPDGTRTEADLRVIDEAIAVAMARRPDVDPHAFALVGLVLRAELGSGPGPVTDARMRFQQLTGPVMAKGVEDTVFYDHVPLGSLNEVGSDPSVFALDPATVHAALVRRAVEAPRSMLALSTHDTKRSEDVRARLAVLSEAPGLWADALRRWRDAAEPHRLAVQAPGWPDPRMEHLLWQTLVGAHPLPVDRAVAYMAKAAKEAKRHTSWTDPVPAYDDALRAFVESVCADEGLMDDVAAVVAPLVEPGRINSLSQKLVALTAPGVPDVYQGTELWDLSLVDPDNRRPVDVAARAAMLDDLDGDGRGGPDPAALWAGAADGRPKLWVVHRALRLRAAHPEWFDGTEHVPLAVSGPMATHAFAYLRGGSVAVVVPRLPLGLAAGGGWGETTVDLPEGEWYDELGTRSWVGGTISVRQLLDRFPVALLRRTGGGRR